MVAVYVSLMIAGRRTFAQVPPILQEDVKKDLTAIGLGELAE